MWMRDIDNNYIVDKKHLAAFLFWALRASEYFTTLVVLFCITLFAVYTLSVDYSNDGHLDTPYAISEGVSELQVGMQPGHTLLWHTHKASHHLVTNRLQIDPKFSFINEPDPYANGFDGHGNKR